MICFDSLKNLNIGIQENQLAVSPCCLLPVRTVDKIDFYNNQYINEIRTQWLAGTTPTKCQSCTRVNGSNQWYEVHHQATHDIELIRIDYWTGNTCNLCCVICGPHNSSAWEQELKIPSRQQINNKFWQELDLTKLKFIHFNGGEPLLSKEHQKFLSAIPDPAQVELNYNTNGTILPNTDLLNLWSKFKLVILDFSIDDIEEKFEYIRYPAKWEQVVKNLQWYIEKSPVNCMFAVNTSVGFLNSNTDNLDRWLKDNFLENRLGDPIEHRKQPVFGLLSLTNKKYQQIFNYLDQCDARRNTNWRQIFPDLLDRVPS